MKIKIIFLFFGLFILSCNNSTTLKNVTYQWPDGITPPIAEKKAKELIVHGDVRIDNYYWMNDFFKKGPDSTNVVNYLKAENAYLDTMMSGLKGLRETLFSEMKGRIKEKDESVPYKDNGYWYYARFEEGKQYAVYCRKKENLDAHEEIIHNANIAAEGKNYYSAAGLKVSDNNEFLAIGEDDVSRRLYKLKFKNLKTGIYFPETILNTEGGSYAWAADNKTVFYIKKDLTTLLGNQVWRHQVGTDPAKDTKVYEEKDYRHYMGVSRSKSKKYVFIYSELGEQQSEVLYLDAEKPNGEFSVFNSRSMGLLYDVDHFENNFFIRTNLQAPNFRLMECALGKTNVENWKEVIAHRPDVYLSSVSVFNKHLVVSELKAGLTQIRIINPKSKSDYYLEFSEPAYLASVGANPDFNTNVLRFNYTSFVTPNSVFDYNMDTKERELKKQTEVVGGYNKDEFVSERIFVKATDGSQIPVSIIYKKGMLKNGENPLLLYAYGSYGSNSFATFSSNRLSLLNRGFIYALAHIRGGQEMGRQWYDEGKMLNKKNTFTDFINCGEFLVKEEYTSSKHLYAMGGSAGGLLMGAISNMAPDLWNGIIAAVPFVDVITTMSDASIPLTTGEYLEWGNPSIKEEYFYMKSYSPIDNVGTKNYPNMLVTTGLHDSQVQYFEPAKWVAKLRELKTDKNKLFLNTNMDAGHGGASGRFDYLKDIALQYSFLFALEGITK